MLLPYTYPVCVGLLVPVSEKLWRVEKTGHARDDPQNADLGSPGGRSGRLLYFQQQFHKYREAMFNQSVIDAESKHKKIEDTIINKMKFDCYVINKICDYYGFNVVIRDVHINFNKKSLSRRNCSYPSSSIPNCTIICVRNNDIIESMK